MNEQKLAQGLGWFSIGLGLTELLAPAKLSETIGIGANDSGSGHERLMQTLGAREITSGIGILTSDLPMEWMWSRVAGDVMDVSLMTAALRSEKNDRQRVVGTLAALAGVTVLDVFCGIKLTQAKRQRGMDSPATYQGNRPRLTAGQPKIAQSDTIRHSITIAKPAIEIYEFWRKLENFPSFMTHVKAVETLPDGRSHWVAKGPAGTTAEWDAEITEDRKGEVIAWRSLPNSVVRNQGSVRFQPGVGNRGTIVQVELEYRAPGGKAGSLLTKLFGQSPDKQIRVELHRVKQLIETGEIARTEGQSAGRPTSTSPRYDNLIRS